jgi:outer membrane murein-binding lipoprotein Lpp
MKKRIFFIFITAVILLLPLVFAGCQSGGVSQGKYDELNNSYQSALAQIETLNDQVSSLNSQVDADSAAIQAKDDKLAYYESRVADLQSQVNALKAEYELAGATPAETAANIVRYYHDTHVYSKYDLFVCSDMAAEVWNMLKAVGINSIVAVGNVDTAVSDILDSNHAWVLAEVDPGQYLALETTGGFTVSESENPLYYHGWSFVSPADLKSYNDLVKEYNIRVGFRNLLAGEVNEAASLYNSSSGTEADKWLALHDKLHELMTDQETVLNTLMAQINSLASVIQ